MHVTIWAHARTCSPMCSFLVWNKVTSQQPFAMHANACLPVPHVYRIEHCSQRNCHLSCMHTYIHSRLPVLTCVGWNILDFIVVIAGILDLIGLGNYSAIRCLRVLRPLRAITKIEALRVRMKIQTFESCRLATESVGGPSTAHDAEQVSTHPHAIPAPIPVMLLITCSKSCVHSCTRSLCW